MLAASIATPAAAQAVSSDASAAQFLRLGASASMALQTSSAGSALEQIMRVQGDTAAPTAAAAPAPASAPSPAPLASGLIRASYVYAPPAPPARSYVAPRAGAGVRRGSGPDVFGSTAIAVSGSALSWRWRQVSAAAAPTSAGWAQQVRTLSRLPMPERLARANVWVNRSLEFSSDARIYGQSDHWAGAREALARGRGDCEDYAITKLQLLRAAGVPASDLFLVVLRDTVRRSDHAVLAVRVDDRFFVLDNGADEVLDSEDVRDYRPVVTFSAAGTWVHGFRERPAVVMAANTAVAPAGPGRP